MFYYINRNVKFLTHCMRCLYTSKMAKSKFEYVRNFENEDRLLPNCWIVVRIDGKGFHKFSSKHNFQKPNDNRALNLMNRAAAVVMNEFKDISICYGQSDEYSFILRKDTDLYNRRGSKIMSYINSLFSSAYIFFWRDYFKGTFLKMIPSFDARIVLYPTDENLRDYLSWRQADCHINNLYNTVFWALILKGNLSNTEAEKRLCGTLSSDKNEILFSEFNINYNNEPEMYRKGTILLRLRLEIGAEKKRCILIVPQHEDLIQDKFWEKHSDILLCKNTLSFAWPENVDLPDLIKAQLNRRDTEKVSDINTNGIVIPIN